MAEKFFFFNRETTVKKEDEKGNPIPLKVKVKKLEGNREVEVEEVVPGKFETEKVTVKDNFNISKVIRSHTVKPGHVVVLLDDGHEEAQDIPVQKGRNIEMTRQRNWVQSEISLKGDDVTRYYEALSQVQL